LQYYNARYYDPAIGVFISPDTVVPDGTNVFDYNRYMYVRGRVFNANDPTGHCVNNQTTNNDGEIAYNNDECWRLANTIGAMWDDTDYWSNRYGSKDTFFDYVTTDATNGTDFFQEQLNNFLNSDEGNTWLNNSVPIFPDGEQDWGDYTAVTGSFGFYGAALIVDDYGNMYIRSDNNFVGSPGIGISRGDIIVSKDDGTWMDIDHIGLSRADKASLAPNILVGPSRGGSAGVGFMTLGGAYNLQGPTHFSVEGGLGSSPISASYSAFSYTFQVYPVFRYK